MLSLPCSELRRKRRCPWRGGTVAKHQIHRLSTRKTRLHGFTNNVCAFHWALCASPFLTFTLHLLTYFAEACVKTKIFPHFPLCLSPAWHPRICLWSQHKAWLCSKCTHSGGSAWEVQSAHTDLCEACVVGKRQIWKCNDCFFFVRSYSCASTNMLLAFEVLQLAFPCSWSQAI